MLWLALWARPEGLGAQPRDCAEPALREAIGRLRGRFQPLLGLRAPPGGGRVSWRFSPWWYGELVRPGCASAAIRYDRVTRTDDRVMHATGHAVVALSRGRLVVVASGPARLEDRAFEYDGPPGDLLILTADDLDGDGRPDLVERWPAAWWSPHPPEDADRDEHTDWITVAFRVTGRALVGFIP